MEKEELKQLLLNYGTYRLAKQLGLKHPTIHTWIKYGWVPAKHATNVAYFLGRRRGEICPQVFGHEIKPTPTREAASV